MLSPNYFASEWCRKEWTEYLRLEHGLSRSEGGILPVYFSYMPGLDPAEQIKLEAQLQLWVDDCNTRQRHFNIDLRQWFAGGADAILALDIEQRLAGLSANPRCDAALRPQDLADQFA